MAIRMFRRFGKNETGAAMLEAALVLPVLVIMLVGMVEFTDAFTARRRVEAVAASVADLVAQGASITADELNQIGQLAERIIAPYNASNLSLRISSVIVDDNNKDRVAWSYAKGALSPRACNVPVDGLLPDGLKDPTSSVIYVETSYEFTPTVGFKLMDGLTFSSEAFYRPRLTKTVSHNGC